MVDNPYRIVGTPQRRGQAEGVTLRSVMKDLKSFDGGG